MSVLSRRGLWPYVIMTLFWCLLALVYGSQAWMREGMPWHEAMWMGTAEWLPWIIVSPALFATVRRFPIGRERWGRALAVNIAMCLACVFAAEGIFGLVHRAPARRGLRQPPAREDAGPPRFPPGSRPDGPPGPVIRGPGQHIMNFHLPMALFVVMASNAYVYFQQLRDRERKAAELARNLVEARLHSLQTQLQPHFLFNALNATAALVRRDPQAAEEMIANLSELLRLALASRDRHEVALHQELSHVESYLEIERVRFGDRLVVHRDIDAAAGPAFVPVLILQPLVENAIRHGVERRDVDVGQIWISAHVLDGRLRLAIRDNGPGPQAAGGTRRGHGIGLDNTRARLKALHGESAELRLEAAVPGGCLTTIEMPLLLQPSQLHETESTHR